MIARYRRLRDILFPLFIASSVNFRSFRISLSGTSLLNCVGAARRGVCGAPCSKLHPCRSEPSVLCGVVPFNVACSCATRLNLFGRIPSRSETFLHLSVVFIHAFGCLFVPPDASSSQIERFTVTQLSFGAAMGGSSLGGRVGDSSRAAH